MSLLRPTALLAVATPGTMAGGGAGATTTVGGDAGVGAAALRQLLQ